MKKQPLELNSDFKYVLNTIENTNKSLFVTGRAGTGKSTLLSLLKNTTKKKCVVLAPTGIAALNIEGQTIHSFFRFPAKPLTSSDIKRRKNRKLYQNIELLIIDEISMVRADLLDNINYFLQINRDNLAPFGGVQLLFFGDLFQLPPIVSSEAEQYLFDFFYESPYFFSAKVLKKEIELETVELRKVYRQEERHFLRLLDAVRSNSLDLDDLNDINERYIPDFNPDKHYITICPRNYQVDKINNTQLTKINNKTFIFQADIKGNFKPTLYPTEQFLKLKEGAQVMFIKNDPKKQFVNGTIGVVKKIDDKYLIVTIKDKYGRHDDVEVTKMDWSILKYSQNREKPNEIQTEEIGTFTQIPLKLAWAVTIHKSQGKTFDNVIIDMGRGAFENGQTYVALSRCRTFEGIILNQKLRINDIMVDEKIIDFYDTQR